MYYHGLGVKKDYKEAARWVRKAADQGDAQAQYNLGTICETGRGVKQELEEALAWYIKAAKQGHKGAIKRVNRLAPTPLPEPIPDYDPGGC